MQESFSIPLAADLIFPEETDTIIPFIVNLFTPGGLPFAQLIEALKQEEKEKFGSPEIRNLRFELKRFDPVTLNGRLRLLYNLQLTFSCSALVNNLDNQHSYWNFAIDPSAKIIRFEGDEYGDLRSTADEF